jgi:hypothetical protein
MYKYEGKKCEKIDNTDQQVLAITSCNTSSFMASFIRDWTFHQATSNLSQFPQN